MIPDMGRFRKNSESPQFNSKQTEFLRIQLHYRSAAIWLKYYGNNCSVRTRNFKTSKSVIPGGTDVPHVR